MTNQGQPEHRLRRVANPHLRGVVRMVCACGWKGEWWPLHHELTETRLAREARDHKIAVRMI